MSPLQSLHGKIYHLSPTCMEPLQLGRGCRRPQCSLSALQLSRCRDTLLPQLSCGPSCPLAQPGSKIPCQVRQGPGGTCWLRSSSPCSSSSAKLLLLLLQLNSSSCECPASMPTAGQRDHWWGRLIRAAHSQVQRLLGCCLPGVLLACAARLAGRPRQTAAGSRRQGLLVYHARAAPVSLREGPGCLQSSRQVTIIKTWVILRVTYSCQLSS